MKEERKNMKFKDFKEKFSCSTLKAIKDMGFKRMTNIQEEVLPKALDGEDLVATAKTGSGKTLAFLIPVIEVVIGRKHEGTCCIILSPTRELATQTYTILQDLIAYHAGITTALVIGGENRKQQGMELAKGVDIVVATPGRLFDHMRTKEFDYKHVCCLVLDEADKIFQYGFEEDLKQILNRLPKNRQTMLFSATQSERTDALIVSAMKDNVISINTDQDDLKATVEGLKQGYAICETEYRMWWLHKVLKKTKNCKIMVFFSSCKSVVFHHQFFGMFCNMPVLCIHGKMNQVDRTAVITDFYNAEVVALFCTDLAARGLDIPAVDWIVQFDPPADTNVSIKFNRLLVHSYGYVGQYHRSDMSQEYIHRVGRTARGLGAAGNAVLLLRPEEKEFVDYLQEAKIYLDKYEAWNTFYNLQPKLDAAMADPNFAKLASEAFEGYMRALQVRKLKHVFNVLTMDVDLVAKSFGLKERPEIDMRIGFSKKHRPRKRMAVMLAAQNDSKRLK